MLQIFQKKFKYTSIILCIFKIFSCLYFEVQAFIITPFTSSSDFYFVGYMTITDLDFYFHQFIRFYFIGYMNVIQLRFLLYKLEHIAMAVEKNRVTVTGLDFQKKEKNGTTRTLLCIARKSNKNKNWKRKSYF